MHWSFSGNVTRILLNLLFLLLEILIWIWRQKQSRSIWDQFLVSSASLSLLIKVGYKSLQSSSRNPHCVRKFSKMSREVVICVPLKMDKGKQDRDEIVITLLDMMVERRLRRLLRAEMGHVYNISTKTLFDGKWYASLGSEEAVMTVSFCFEETSETWTSKDSRSIDWKLVDRVLQEIEDLRNGPSEVDVACFREIETEKLSCSDVLKEVMHAYQAKLYKGDLQGTCLELLKTKQEILGSDNVQFWGTEIRRIMPDNCTLRNVCLALHSRASPEEEGSEYDSDSDGDDEEESEDE